MTDTSAPQPVSGMPGELLHRLHLAVQELLRPHDEVPMIAAVLLEFGVFWTRPWDPEAAARGVLRQARAMVELHLLESFVVVSIRDRLTTGHTMDIAAVNGHRAELRMALERVLEDAQAFREYAEFTHAAEAADGRPHSTDDELRAALQRTIDEAAAPMGAGAAVHGWAEEERWRQLADRYLGDQDITRWRHLFVEHMRKRLAGG